MSSKVKIFCLLTKNMVYLGYLNWTIANSYNSVEMGGHKYFRKVCDLSDQAIIYINKLLLRLFPWTKCQLVTPHYMHFGNVNGTLLMSLMGRVVKNVMKFAVMKFA